MSLFSRKQKNKFVVKINVVSLSSVPYTNGYFYCKLRQLSNGKFESKTKREQIKNNCIFWNKEFCFETTVAEAKLRISVRREGAGVGKSEIKLGYIDVNLSKFYNPGKEASEYRHVLTGYEKSNQRSDNSILLIRASLESESGAIAEPLRTQSTDSQKSSKVHEVQEHTEPDGLRHEIFDKTKRINGHSRTSSGASGYSSSNASLNKAENILTKHKREASWSERISIDGINSMSLMDPISTDPDLDNEAIVNSLFAQVQHNRKSPSLEKIPKSSH